MYAGLQVQQLQLTQTQMGLTQTQTGLTLLALPVKRSELVRWMCEKQGELILVAAVHCGRMSIFSLLLSTAPAPASALVWSQYIVRYFAVRHTFVP